MFNSFLKPLFYDLKTLFLDTLFPIYCLVCETEGPKFICNDCVNKLTPLPFQLCIICHKMSIGGLTHPKCQSPHSPDALISIFNYTDKKIANILIKGKYSFLPAIYNELGILMAKKLTENFPSLLNANHYTLTAIPLHWMRQRWRGFNQSQILAETLSKELNMPVANILERKRFTKTQKNLKKEERIKNINNAFKLKDDTDVHNQNIILIDDVSTTGSTLLEAVKVLKRNGASKVYCLTVARD